MSTCIGCSRKERDLPIVRKDNYDYTAGDVYGMKESVYTPIYHILQQPESNLGYTSEAFKRSQLSLCSITSVPDVIEKPRPAIIMYDQDNNTKGLMVCLTTTYKGDDISTLPRIFQHFSVPIAPHSHISPGHLCHLHSLPEWERWNGWVIAYRFRCKATRDKIWEKNVGGEALPYVFGRDAMAFLADECSRKLSEWRVMCRDSKLAAAFEREVAEHYREQKKQDAAGGKAASSDSVATVNNPSNVNKGRRPPTISEEPERNMVPGAGRSREPIRHKASGKVRTGSTYSLASTSGKAKADADKNSIKSNRSRTSVVGQSQSSGKFANKFAVLRAVAPAAA